MMLSCSSHDFSFVHSSLCISYVVSFVLHASELIMRAWFRSAVLFAFRRFSFRCKPCVYNVERAERRAIKRIIHASLVFWCCFPLNFSQRAYVVCDHCCIAIECF